MTRAAGQRTCQEGLAQPGKRNSKGNLRSLRTAKQQLVATCRECATAQNSSVVLTDGMCTTGRRCSSGDPDIRKKEFPEREQQPWRAHQGISASGGWMKQSNSSTVESLLKLEVEPQTPTDPCTNRGLHAQLSPATAPTAWHCPLQPQLSSWAGLEVILLHKQLPVLLLRTAAKAEVLPEVLHQQQLQPWPDQGTALQPVCASSHLCWWPSARGSCGPACCWVWVWRAGCCWELKPPAAGWALGSGSVASRV